MDIENRGARPSNSSGNIRGGRRPFGTRNEQSLNSGLRKPDAPTRELPAATKKHAKHTKPAAASTVCYGIAPTRGNSVDVMAQTGETMRRDKRCRSKPPGNSHSWKFWGAKAGSTASLAVALAFSVASQIEPSLVLLSVCYHIAVGVAVHLKSASDNKRLADITKKADLLVRLKTAMGNELVAARKLRDDSMKKVDAAHKASASMEEDIIFVREGFAAVAAAMAAQEEQRNAQLQAVYEYLADVALM